jgi:hypothetical protein
VPDYAHAKVYFSSMAGSDTLDSVQAGLQQASGFLRSELGKRISIHMIPQLHFVFDDSLERGAQLSKLISEAAAISDHGEEPDQGLSWAESEKVMTVQEELAPRRWRAAPRQADRHVLEFGAAGGEASLFGSQGRAHRHPRSYGQRAVAALFR